MPGKAIDRDDRRGTVTPPAIEPIHPLKSANRNVHGLFLLFTDNGRDHQI